MKNINFVLGLIVMLLGIIILIQTSDMNPLLRIESYQIWLNTHYYITNGNNLNIWITILTYVIGGLVIFLGYQLSFSKTKKENFVTKKDNLEKDCSELNKQNQKELCEIFYLLGTDDGIQKGAVGNTLHNFEERWNKFKTDNPINGRLMM